MSLWGAKVSSNQPCVLAGSDDFVGTGIYNAALVSANGGSVHLYLHIGTDKFLVGTFRAGSVEQIPLTIEISPDDDSTYQFSVEPNGSEVHLTGALIEPDGFPEGYDDIESDDDDLIGLREGDDDEGEAPNIEDVTNELKPGKAKHIKMIRSPEDDKPQDAFKHEPKQETKPVEKPKEVKEKKPKTGVKPQPAQSGQPTAVKTEQTASEGDGKKGKKRPASGEQQPSVKKQKVEGTVSCSNCPKRFQNEQALAQHINSKHADLKKQ